jgi:hypothetical protein
MHADISSLERFQLPHLYLLACSFISLMCLRRVHLRPEVRVCSSTVIWAKVASLPGVRVTWIVTTAGERFFMPYRFFLGPHESYDLNCNHDLM